MIRVPFGIEILCCRRAKEPKEEVGAGLAWETKLIGLLDRDCNSTEVVCEALLVPTDEAVAKSL